MFASINFAIFQNVSLIETKIEPSLFYNPHHSAKKVVTNIVGKTQTDISTNSCI